MVSLPNTMAMTMAKPMERMPTLVFRAKPRAMASSRASREISPTFIAFPPQSANTMHTGLPVCTIFSVGVRVPVTLSKSNSTMVSLSSLAT